MSFVCLFVCFLHSQYRLKQVFNVPKIQAVLPGPPSLEDELSLGDHLPFSLSQSLPWLCRAGSLEAALMSQKAAESRGQLGKRRVANKTGLKREEEGTVALCSSADNICSEPALDGTKRLD